MEGPGIIMVMGAMDVPLPSLSSIGTPVVDRLPRRAAPHCHEDVTP